MPNTTRRTGRNRKRTGPLRYAIYLRCSTDDQSEGDYTTIDTQREYNEQYVRENGGILAGTYSDPGLTGTNLRRPGWRKLLQDAEDGLFDVVVVTYLSRLARGKVYYRAEELLEECGVRVELVREQFAEDANGQISKDFKILLDGVYPKMVSQWTTTKMEGMFANGYLVGAYPFGFDREFVFDAPVVVQPGKKPKDPPKRLVRHPEHGDIVEHVYDLFLERRTIEAARQYLLSVTDRAWTTTQAKALLTNEAYTGVQVWRGQRNETGYPVIVAREKWQAVQDILAERKRGQGPGRAAITEEFMYYLRERIFCPYCGCNYTNSVAKGGLVRYYECLGYKKKRTDCPIKRVNAVMLHRSVLREIERAARHHTVMHRIIAESGGWSRPTELIKYKRKHVLAKRKKMQDEITGLLGAIGQGVVSASLVERLTALENEKMAVAEELARVEEEIERSTVPRPTAQEVMAYWSQALDLWPRLSEDERKAVLQGLVVRVEVREKNKASMQLLPVAGGLDGQVRNKVRNGSGKPR